MKILMPFLGLLDPKTQKSTGYYAGLGILCADIWHRGIHQWNLIALILFAGLGSLSSLAHFLAKSQLPPVPPDPPAPPAPPSPDR